MDKEGVVFCGTMCYYIHRDSIIHGKEVLPMITECHVFTMWDEIIKHFPRSTFISYRDEQSMLDWYSDLIQPCPTW